jgi:uroporphyrin-III C-methyltransferase/precorrin-2 dehydrogenase/sirohydrochlorin ferrochelatase
MVKLARAGHRVVRLKGGDPFIFGRGGEEIEALAANEIPFEIVPGVTAAAGAAAYAGIPLTHRDCADACVFITGHVRKESNALDLRGVVRPRQTIVVYMGVGALGKVCGGLKEQGLASSVPCAMVEKATLPGQRVVEGTLASLPGLVAAQDIRPPALLIVGEVVRLRAKLAWYQERQLVRSNET